MANDNNISKIDNGQNKDAQDVQFYKQAYEQERARAASLAGRLADAKNRSPFPGTASTGPFTPPAPEKSRSTI